MIGKAAINRSNTTYNNALNTTTTNRTTTTTKAKEVTTTTTTTTPTMAAYVPLPDDADIEALVLAKKKRELLEKYQSAGLSKNEAEAKNLLNKKDF